MKSPLLVPALLLAALQWGCLVQVKSVDDPGAAFADALAEARRLDGRSGPPQHLQILAFDDADRKLVRLRLPIWLLGDLDEDDLDLDVHWDDDGEMLKRHVRRHLRLSEIEKAGLGVVVEIEERSGDRVLIWLS
jgi:hypothetical protein